MNVDLQNELARRADSVEPPTFDPSAVVAHGERLVRRRNGLTAAGAVLALALTIGTTTLLLDQGTDRTAPSQRPAPGGSTRPISYGQEQILHLGDREIDTGLDYLSLDLTDEGAALTTWDGGVWFTDGTAVERVGTTLGPRAVADGVIPAVNGSPAEWVVNDSSGSLLAWMEYPRQRPGRPELVVYDSGSRAVLAREPVEVADRNSASVFAIAGREVFVAEDSPGNFTVSMLRYDVDSGVLERVDDAYVKAARRGVPRALVVGATAEYGRLLHWEAFPSNTVESLTVRDSRLTGPTQPHGLFDPSTGDRVEIRVPAGYDHYELGFVQWLDDDRFTLVRGVTGPDLLVCHIAAGRCDVALDASTWTTPPLLPGHGHVGGDRALVRAAADARRGG